MMKKNLPSFLSGMLVMLLIVVLTGSAVATNGKITKELEYRDIAVTLDGQSLDLRDAAGNPVEPFMFDGTNYLPVRALAKALGLEVSWNGATSTVVLQTPGIASGTNENQPTQSVQPAQPTAPSAPSVSTLPTLPAESDPEHKTVYVTRTGKKYHYNSNCNGGTYIASTLSRALAQGLQPCNKCVS